jgi:hypothetical protein
MILGGGGGRDRRVIETEVAEIKLSPLLKATGEEGGAGSDGGDGEGGGSGDGDGDVEMREDGK